MALYGLIHMPGVGQKRPKNKLTKTMMAKYFFVKDIPIVDRTGVEPATSSMPWKRSSQLS